LRKKLTPLALARAAGRLAASRKPVVVCGTDLAGPELAGWAADAALLLAAAHKNAGLFYILPGANAFAAGLLAPDAPPVDRILQAAAAGEVQALVLVENDPVATFPDRALLERALASIELLVVLDYLDTAVSRRAHVFLPTQVLYESGAVFINQEGRVQRSARAFAGGTPVLETGGGDHPPRVYGAGLPGADPQPAGEIMARLAGSPSLGRTTIGGVTLPEDGMRVALKEMATERLKSILPPGPAAKSDELEIILAERTFGTEELSSYSACLEALQEKPFAGLHPRDAESLGVRAGDHIAVPAGASTVELAVSVFDDMAPGVMVVPRLRRLPWQAFAKFIRREDIRRR